MLATQAEGHITTVLLLLRRGEVYIMGMCWLTKRWASNMGVGGGGGGGTAVIIGGAYNPGVYHPYAWEPINQRPKTVEGF